MADSVDDLTVEWEEGGDKVVRELAKEVMSRGAWATVVFLCQDLDRKKRQYRAPKISIRRFKKVGGQYRYQSKFNISSENQALQLVEIIQKWFNDGGVGRDAPAEPREGDLKDAAASEAAQTAEVAASVEATAGAGAPQGSGPEDLDDGSGEGA
ncbi:MAG: hypothetical protein ABIJ09_08870 [Pseudomonadota bacterium]